MPQPEAPLAPDPDWRLSPAQRKQRAVQDGPWLHALQRMQQRHSPDATLPEIKVLAIRAMSIYGSWRAKCRTSEGRVVTYENAQSVVIMLPWRTAGNNIKVVLNPQLQVLRTVLP